MSQMIAVSKWRLRNIFFICIATIICIATLGLGLGLGFGTGGRKDTPAEALQYENRVLPRGITQMSAGENHTMVIDSQGNLWAFGRNYYGQLGDRTTTNSSTPINITAQAENPLFGKQFVQVSTGSYHTMAIDSAGNLWAFGSSNVGQLGNMSTTNSSTPINLSAPNTGSNPSGVNNPLLNKQFVQVSTGYHHTMAIDSTGNLWAWGYNDFGQLGNMSTGTTNSTPVNITAQPGNPLLNRQFVQVSASYYYTMSIDSTGNLWAWGGNYYGQLGNMSTTNSSTPINLSAPNTGSNPSGVNNPLLNKQFVQVSAGYDHTMSIDSTGNLWAWGGNTYGQLGNMSTGTTNSTPVNITAQPGNPLLNRQFVQVSASYYYTMAIDSTGDLWARGYNSYGQLGNMSTTNISTSINLSAPHTGSNPSGENNPLLNKQMVQVSAGGFHTMAIDSTGDLWAFGNNSNGQLGNGSNTSSSTPINISAQAGNPLNNSQFGRMQVSVGSNHTMAIDAQGNLWAFGSNNYGQLGNMTTSGLNANITPINITAQSNNPLNGNQIVQISAGEAHTVAIDSQGNLWTFGQNRHGQLGNMSTTDSSTPINITAQSGNPLNGKQVVQISAGDQHTIVIDSQGNLWAFGYNSLGQLGNMLSTDSSTPINITAQSGNPLNGKQIVQISVGCSDTMAIDSQGNFWAFGYNYYGQLGNMSTAFTNSTPINITAQSGNPLNGKQIIQVSAGGYHTLVIDSQSNLWAFGQGSYGQIGNLSLGTTNSTPVNITAQAGNPLNGKQFVQVSAGETHTMATDSHGNLWAFGKDGSGQLGNMSTNDSSTPINITAQSGNPLNGKQVVQISAGANHTMAIDSQGNLWAFGSNGFGQLGNISTNSSSTPINISTIAATSATISGNPNARISVRTNFTTGWGTATASGGTFTNWTANKLSSPAITKNNDTQAGRVRYEFDIGKYNVISELSIDGTTVNMADYLNLALFNNILYLRILTSDSRMIVEIDRINTKLFIPVTISATTTRNVGHSFNFSNNSHLSSRMKVTPGSGADTTSLTHIYNDLVWNDNTANITTSAIFTFTSQAAFTKITISRPSQSDATITDFANPFISIAGLAGTLIYTSGSINTMTIILNSMEQYDYTWTIETRQIIQVQHILNPPAGATAIANPPLLTPNSSSGAGWADVALAAPANLFGKTFAGWYTHPDYIKGIQITTTEQLQQHIAATGGAIVFLYARWT